jgi:bacterioferritin (cytochrome b1)
MDFLHVGHKSKQSSRTMSLLEAIHDVNTKLMGETACLQKHIDDITKLLKEKELAFEEAAATIAQLSADVNELCNANNKLYDRVITLEGEPKINSERDKLAIRVESTAQEMSSMKEEAYYYSVEAENEELGADDERCLSPRVRRSRTPAAPNTLFDTPK